MTGSWRPTWVLIAGPGWAWLAQAHDYVRARRINTLKHETAQDSPGAVTHLRAYRDAGFRAEA